MSVSTRIPKYRCHKTGQAFVQIKNQRIYLGKHGTEKSKEAYRRIIAERFGSPQAPVIELASTRAGISVNELLLAYMQHVEAYYVKNGQPTWEQANIRQALRPLRELFGHTPAVEFGPRRLQEVQERMVRAGRSRGVINKDIGRVRRAFRWAVQNELIPVTVLQALQTVEGLRRGRTQARETEPIKPVPDPYVNAIRPYVNGRVWTMVQLQILTGMRPGEVTTMRTCDLNTSGMIWEYRPASHKTEHHGHEKVVLIGPKAQELLKPWLRTELQAYLFQPCEAEAERHAQRRRNRKKPMTPSQADRKPKPIPKRPRRDRYDVNSYRQAIQRACDRAFPPPALFAKLDGETKAEWERRLTDEQVVELKAWRLAHRWHPHQLKHNAGTAVRREFGVETARVVLGHRRLSTTEIYAEADLERAKEAIRKLG